MPLGFIVSAKDEALIGASELATIAAVYTEAFSLGSSRVELSLASLGEIQELNSQYRQLDEPTDVLSFQLLDGRQEIEQLPRDAEVLLGSIVICPEKAAAYGETLAQLTHHGLLHVLGYDHEQDMAAWQQQEGPILGRLLDFSLTIPGVPA